MPVRIVAVGLLSVAYLLASHWLMTSAPPSRWAVVAFVAPMLLAVAFGARQGGRHARAALALAGLALLVALALLGIPISAPALYLADNLSITLLLACWFGNSLRDGETPLITGFAARVHANGLTSPMMAYTRQLTFVWTAYFAFTAAASLAIFLLMPFTAWAVFSNLLSPLALVALFIGERLLRYRLHPEFARSRIADAITAYIDSSSARRGPQA